MSDDPNLRLYRSPKTGADLVLGEGAPTPNDSPDLIFHVSRKKDANLEFAGEVVETPSEITGTWASHSLASTAQASGTVSLIGSFDQQNPASLADIHASITLISPVIEITNNKAVLYFPAKYDINVQRGPANNSELQWQRIGDEHLVERCVIIPKPTRLRYEPCASWGGSVRRDKQHCTLQNQLPHFRYHYPNIWQEALALGAHAAQRFRDLPRFWYQESSSWQEARGLPTFLSSGFFYPPALHKETTHCWNDLAELIQRVCTRYRLGNELNFVVCGNWQEGGYPAPGISVIPVPPKPEQPVTEPLGPPTNPNLNLCTLRLIDGHLEFVRPCSGRVIPARKCYVIMNTAFIVRARDGAEIPATEVGIELDVDSWAWQFSASIPRIAALALVRNERLILHVNGHEWHGTVDSWQTSREWNAQGATINGRSLSAELSPSHVLPGSIFEPNERSIIQLAEQALPENWLLDWQADDWLIPGGLFTAHNQTPIEMLKTLAEAAGAYVLPHATERKLTVLKRYPTAPWLWESQLMDLQIPPNIMTVAGSEYIIGQGGDGVYVTGGEQGVTTLVKRTGTAGSALLPMVTNPLVTDVNVATALGIKELAEHLSRNMDTLELPVSKDTGLILPGTMLIADGDRGITRALRVSASNQGKGLVVRQQLTVERHL